MILHNVRFLRGTAILTVTLRLPGRLRLHRYPSLCRCCFSTMSPSLRPLGGGLAGKEVDGAFTEALEARLLCAVELHQPAVLVKFDGAGAVLVALREELIELVPVRKHARLLHRSSKLALGQCARAVGIEAVKGIAEPATLGGRERPQLCIHFRSAPLHVLSLSGRSLHPRALQDAPHCRLILQHATDACCKVVESVETTALSHSDIRGVDPIVEEECNDLGACQRHASYTTRPHRARYVDAGTDEFPRRPLLVHSLVMRRKYVQWRYALVCERLRCEPWRPWGWFTGLVLPTAH